MCKVDKCDGYPFNNGLCLQHYKEALGVVKPKAKRRKRTKKVDAVEVTTTDAVDVTEKRNEENDG